MGKTIRKDRKGVKYIEGQGNNLYTYRCRCNYCTGKNKKIADAHEKEVKEQLKKIGV